MASNVIKLDRVPPTIRELAKLARMAHANDYVAITAGSQALVSSGMNIIAGGTGLTGLTLPKPKPGDRCVIRLATLTSGTVVVTCAAGSTFNGTNNTATFDAANDELVLVCKAEGTEWYIVSNTGTTPVALSTV